jgi:Cu/Ag efflux protein CusF
MKLSTMILGSALATLTSVVMCGAHAQQGQQQQQAAPATRGIAAVDSAVAVATVEAINQQTREVKLRKENGELVELVVGPEARNLAQVKVGDKVTAAYEVGLVVALTPPGSAPARVTDTQIARTPEGARPGGVIRQSVAVTATVVGIDTPTRTVTLRGPQRTVELPVAADIDLSKFKVGDQVSAMYQESVAIRVDPAQ